MVNEQQCPHSGNVVTLHFSKTLVTDPLQTPNTLKSKSSLNKVSIIEHRKQSEYRKANGGRSVKTIVYFFPSLTENKSVKIHLLFSSSVQRHGYMMVISDHG